MNIYNQNILILITSFFITVTAPAQSISGTYQQKDKNNTLILNPDGSFLHQQQAMSFQNSNATIVERTGNWVFEKNLITLNPEKVKRKMTVEIAEKDDYNKDSITIKLTYIQNSIKNDSIEEKIMDFPFWTLYINNEKNPISLIRNKEFESSIPQRTKKIYLDDSNTFTISKKGFKKIGIETTNFDEIYWYTPSIKSKNLLEFKFNVPNPFENSFRGKKLILENGQLYQILKNGEIDRKAYEIPLIKIN